MMQTYYTGVFFTTFSHQLGHQHPDLLLLEQQVQRGGNSCVAENSRGFELRTPVSKRQYASQPKRPHCQEGKQALKIKLILLNSQIIVTQCRRVAQHVSCLDNNNDILVSTCEPTAMFHQFHQERAVVYHHSTMKNDCSRPV